MFLLEFGCDKLVQLFYTVSLDKIQEVIHVSDSNLEIPDFHEKQHFHIFSQLQNTIFNTKSERSLFVDKIPFRTFFLFYLSN